MKKVMIKNSSSGSLLKLLFAAYRLNYIISLKVYINIYILFFDVVPDFKWYSSLYLLQLCFVWLRAATLIRQN